MPSTKKTVTMEVPENMVNLLQSFMASLNMKTPSSSNGNVYFEEKVEKIDQREVSEIVGHRVGADSLSYEFKVAWKGNKNQQWVSEKDCNCEFLISNYLKSIGIHTAYLFCRVSTKDQAESTHLSLQAQEAELRQVASQAGYTRVRVYSISCSAYKGISQQLQVICEAAQKGDAIMVWRVDRLSRNIEECLGMIKEVHQKGVTLYSHNEKITYAENKIEFLQALLDAQKEAYILGQRVKLAVRRKRERGDIIGSVPYGYMHHRIYTHDGLNTEKIVKADNEIEKNIIKRISKEFKDRRSIEQIAYGLNRSGIKKRGRKWSSAMVKKILQHGEEDFV